VVLGLLGACIGSFLNVVAYRLPRECMSVSKPRSRCPRCARPIAWYDNLPVISWLLLLRGKCRGCGLRISVRYPLVELGTAGLFLLVADAAFAKFTAFEVYRFPMEHPAAWLAYFVMATITAALVVLSLIDIDYFILPDEITKPAILAGPVLAAMAPAMQHERFIIAIDAGEWTRQASAAASGMLGLVVAGGLLWLFGELGSRAFKKPAMGFGDVKMIAAMGGCLGLWALLSLAVASVCGALVGIVLRLATKGKYVPFGPFLAVGMWTVMLWGPEILEVYLGLFR